MKKKTTCTIIEFKLIIKLLFKATLTYPQLAPSIPATMLWGPPGVGKSSSTKQACEELGGKFIDSRLSQRDPVDLRGVPEIVDGKTVFRLPEELPREGHGIILFDELSSCDPSLLVAAYELILDRRLGDYRVPPGFYIVAAGNRQEDRSVSRQMPAALANRFMHLEIEPDLQSVLNYLKEKGEFLNGL
ncbi:MAG: MoxR family ATPase [Pseudomonadota bacterium]